jgi:DNA-binding Lrp family transcriptional regulator
MSISAKFPHQLALMLVALQTDKLPICEHLSDPTEKSLVSSLITYMNNRDFRTPITISRKKLGTQIRVGRSTLFNKLRSLKEKGLLEDVVGEKPIRFTEKAIALIQMEWTKQVDRWNEKTDKKVKTFKVGNSVFPQELVGLINRGISEKQLRGLLSEAKKAGLRLQNILRDFTDSLAKYEGNNLFFVIRDILRKTDKICDK